MEKTVGADAVWAYRKDVAKRISFITICIVSVFFVILLSGSIGTTYGFWDVYEVIYERIMGITHPTASPEWWRSHYIWNNSLPPIIISVIAGAGLAIGGTVMQSLMGNPLADPYTTGISSGASLGAVSAIVTGFTFSSISGEMGIVSSAFLGALIPAFLVIFLTRFVGNSPTTMILIGVAISYFFNSMVTYLMITTDTDKLQEAFLWQIGSVSGTGWGDIPLMLTIVVFSGIAVGLVSNKLNLMMLGDKSAKSMGLDIENFRTLCLLLLAFLVASIISYTGIIGFVGLITPHVVRFIIGGDNRFVAPASVAMGAFILVSANLISNLLMPIGDIPIGVVMSFVGAPIFLYLILRSKAGRDMF
ncbi:MAG: iron ABC transporter permease [Thermoplasmatales archaeon]|nr:iron ABC transporter permease [Thermoplasmatales archaeon]